MLLERSEELFRSGKHPPSYRELGKDALAYTKYHMTPKYKKELSNLPAKVDRFLLHSVEVVGLSAESFTELTLERAGLSLTLVYLMKDIAGLR